LDDHEIVSRITKLVSEEHELEKTHVGKGLSPAETERLRSVEVQLDQCWDLLRQRRARREYGQDPDDAIVRDRDTVEGYQQ
jgi:protein-arginine kinase activator protein McsA